MKLKKNHLIWFIILILTVSGCSFPSLPAKEKETDKVQVQADKNSSESGNLQVAESVSGQKDNTVLSPEDYGKISTGIKNSMDVFIESLMLNDLKNATICLHGLDESESVVTLSELQQLMELLHPVEWQMADYRPAGSKGALVTISYTMSDGTVRLAEPFTMVNGGALWTIHYNSFAESFNTLATHMIDKNGIKE